MGKVVQFENKKIKLEKALVEGQEALSIIYNSLDNMYATIKEVESKAAMVENIYNQTIEEYVNEVGEDNVADKYLEYYTAGLGDIGATDFDDIVVTKLSRDDFDQLMLRDDGMEILLDPEKLKEWKDEDGN